MLTATLSRAQSYKSYVPYNKKGLWGYMDTGMVMRVAPFSKLELGFFDNFGLASTTDTNGRMGLINKDMKTVLPAKYTRIEILYGKYIWAELPNRNQKLFGLNGVALLQRDIDQIIINNDNPNMVLVFYTEDIVYAYYYDAKLKKMVLKRKHEGAGKAAFLGPKHYNVTYHYTLDIKEYEWVSGKVVPADKAADLYEKSINSRDYDDIGYGGVDAVPIWDNGDDKQKPTSTYITYGKVESLSVFEKLRKNYFNTRFYHACKDGKWGIVSEDLNIIIPLQYDSIGQCFSSSPYGTPDHLRVLNWVCRLGNYYGIVSTDTSNGLPFAFNKIQYYNQEVVLVKRNNQYGIYDAQCQLAIPCEVDSFEYGYSQSLNWIACGSQIIFKAFRHGKIALYSTKGGKTDYLFDEAYANYDDKSSVYGVTRSISLKAYGKYGLLLCSYKQFVYLPCRYTSLFFYGDYGNFRYFKVGLAKHQNGYIDQRGRKYFEE